MQRDTPKQFILINGQPVLMHTLRVFYRCSPDIRLITVLPEAEIKVWQALCAQYAFEVPHQTTAGGASRTASVYRGLQLINHQDSLVAVHDGVRPLLTPQLVEKSYQQAERHGSAIASVNLKDSIRHVDGNQSQTCAREQYRLMQTPQTFRTEWLIEAYQSIKEGEVFSDDASVLEHHGRTVHLMEGEYRNIKVTTPEDLIVAEALLNSA